MNNIKAIAAMSLNSAIGYKNEIPWHLPEDFKWFKKTTMGGILAMGRKTYESIGKPLPGRETYVFSRSQRDFEGVSNFTDLNILKTLKTDKTIWISGGEEIYRKMLPYCSEIYLTRVKMTCEKYDAIFPIFEDRFRLVEVIDDNKKFQIERWENASRRTNNNS